MNKETYKHSDIRRSNKSHILKYGYTHASARYRSMIYSVSYKAYNAADAVRVARSQKFIPPRVSQ